MKKLERRTAFIYFGQAKNAFTLAALPGEETDQQIILINFGFPDVPVLMFMGSVGGEMLRSSNA